METESAGHPQITTASWVRTTTIGWFLGFFVMLVLIFIWEAILGPGQTMVGVGMGAGVGFWQSRLLKRVLDRPLRWAWATVVGMGAPFAAWDVSAALGREAIFSNMLPICVVLGGLLVAVWQWRLLRPLSQRAGWWILACTIGWAIPSLFIALGNPEAVPAPWGELLSLTGMFLGGILLGATTAKPLVWILGERQGVGSRE